MSKQFGIRSILRGNQFIPIINFNDLSTVEKTINHLISNEITCLEITLRSDIAWDAIELAMKIKPKNFKIGVGTVTSVTHLEKCKSLNIDFIVSPGLSPELRIALNDYEIPFLPGVMTPSDIISGLEQNWDTFKLFPFNLAGGMKALSTYNSVFPEVKFCPTGGVNELNCKDCLEFDNVISVGGSWLTENII
jgi:2-dehydro-3-deoxyphosphogluconate aldolase / (4S)-4-hydroxy-2-oxoglutarate aldolase